MDKNQKETVEIYDGESTVILNVDGGKEVEFYELAGVEYEGEFYEILEPVEPLDGVEEGEVIIFKVTELGDDAYNYDSNISEEIADAVFAEFLRAMPDDECCDCECDDCSDCEAEKK